MSLLETFRLAFSNIMSSKVRSFLTMLGIIIGVTAVMVIVGLGNGLKNYMTESFAELGTDTLTVMINGRGTSRSISVDDMYQIVEDNPDYLKNISPQATMFGQLKIGNETISTTQISGVSEAHIEMQGYDVATGRGLQYLDIKERKKVCVIGKWLEASYFGGDAVGQTLRMGGSNFTIVGVLAQKDDEMEEGGSDDLIFLPYSTAARLSQGNINSYLIQVQDENTIGQAQQIIEDELYNVFQDDDAYTIVSMSEMLDTMNSMIDMVVGVLALIAGISLLVGGVGIMNIMMVSVTERTKEIGIRKALGAREGVILRQFVIEAATTSCLGGLIGIALGFIISAIASPLVSSVLEASMSVSPSLSSVLVAFGISAAIGIFFGYLPAKKAAGLNPIDALRYD